MNYKQELSKHGIHLPSYSAGHGNHKVTCPKCSHQRSKKNDPCLSVTIKDDDNSAVWNCHHCSWTGNVFDKDNKNYNREIKKVYNIPKVINYPMAINHFKDFWSKRHIDEETVKHFDIKEVIKNISGKQQNCLAFPYKVKSKIVNYKYRSVNKEFRQEANTRRTLFNIDSIKDNKEIIFVEGEMDVLALYQCGIKNVVSLPDGAPQEAKFREDDKRFDALKECAEELSKAEKVIIAVDMDSAGQALSQELAHRFGKDRCYTVDWNGDYKDANDALIGNGAGYVQDVILKAKPYPIDGLYKVEDYTSEVTNLYNGTEERPLSTGYTALDSIYKLMTGTFAVITGIPNHGKSNFLDQILINASRLHNWKFAIFSPEHSTPRHLSRLVETHVGKPFSEGATRRMHQTEMNDSLKYLNEHFFFLESGEERPTIEWVLDKARIACIRNRINGLVIDPYNEIDVTDRGSKREDEHIRDIIAQCKRFAKTHDVCIWVVAHPSKMHRNNDGTYPVPSMYDISGSAHWHNMADVGICVHRNFDEDKTIIYLKKVREQGLYGEIGEALFTYNVETKNYSEVIEEPNPSNNVKYWND
tara:strand:+ start:776 stop:2533 length:1758 start_codon:yes stop_codon:yes gene_type:complete